MIAARLSDAGSEATVTVVTPEDAPLALFGAPPRDAGAALLRERGVDVRTGRYPAAWRRADWCSYRYVAPDLALRPGLVSDPPPADRAIPVEVPLDSGAS